MICSQGVVRVKQAKVVLTVVLLVFVAVSVGCVFIKESSVTAERESSPSTVNKAKTAQSEPGRKAEPQQLDSRVVAYYFHGNIRCDTCREIEAYAKEAIETGFRDALKSGRLEFRAVNVDESQNEHFVQDYELSTGSVVIVQFKNGKQTEWKNLQLVWEFVRDRDAFFTYIQEETKSLLDLSS